MGNVGASLICYADSSAGSYTFTVPLLSALPGSFLDANGNVQGKLDVSEIVSGAPFTASGLDLGTINFGVHFTRSLVNIL
jgi:hypothetical protein